MSHGLKIRIHDELYIGTLIQLILSRSNAFQEQRDLAVDNKFIASQIYQTISKLPGQRINASSRYRTNTGNLHRMWFYEPVKKRYDLQLRKVATNSEHQIDKSGNGGKARSSETRVRLKQIV